MCVCPSVCVLWILPTALAHSFLHIFRPNLPPFLLGWCPRCTTFRILYRSKIKLTTGVGTHFFRCFRHIYSDGAGAVTNSHIFTKFAHIIAEILVVMHDSFKFEYSKIQRNNRCLNHERGCFCYSVPTPVALLLMQICSPAAL